MTPGGAAWCCVVHIHAVVLVADTYALRRRVVTMLRRGVTHPHPDLIDHAMNWCGECEQYAAQISGWLCPVCLDRAKHDRQFASRTRQHRRDRDQTSGLN